MSLKNCKKILKDIQHNEKCIVALNNYIEKQKTLKKKYKNFIKEDKKKLNKQLKKLSTTEFTMFAIDTGYIE